MMGEVSPETSPKNTMIQDMINSGGKEFGIFAQRAMVDQAREGLCYQ